jgi:hypothetical protein
MGSDALFHKRKQKELDSFKRQIDKRKSYEAILIVCEGEKTELNYLKDLREHLGLNRANVEIRISPSGNDPGNVVKYALAEYDKHKDYDRVYCVFDKDQHTTYLDAKNEVEKKFSIGIPIYAIISVPCFEYWILLHFVYSTKPYAQKGNRSPADQLVKEIKKYICNYHKGYSKIFDETKHNLETALTHAKSIDTQQEKNNTDNPSTKIYKLVEYLRKL